MNKQTEALKLALEAMQFALHVGFDESSESQIKKGDKAVRQHETAITAIRGALADSALERMAENAREIGLDYKPAQQQEPVAWMNKHGACMSAVFKEVEEAAGEYTKPLYTFPPASKPWVGLTDEQINEFFEGMEPNNGFWLSFARAIEAKLREKNT